MVGASESETSSGPVRCGYLVNHPPQTGGDHHLLENSPLQCPDFTVHHGSDGSRPLAVVENRQLSKHLPHPQVSKDPTRLADLELTLGSDVEVGAGLSWHSFRIYLISCFPSREASLLSPLSSHLLL